MNGTFHICLKNFTMSGEFPYTCLAWTAMDSFPSRRTLFIIFSPSFPPAPGHLWTLVHSPSGVRRGSGFSVLKCLNNFYSSPCIRDVLWDFYCWAAWTILLFHLVSNRDIDTLTTNTLRPVWQNLLWPCFILKRFCEPPQIREGFDFCWA